MWTEVLNLCVVLCKLTQILPDNSTDLVADVYLPTKGYSELLRSQKEVGVKWVPQLLNDTCQWCYSEWQNVYVENASLYTSFLLFTSESGFNYTKVNKSDIPQSLTAGGFDPSRDTKLVVHGWFSNGSNYAAETLVKGYLNSTQDLNIISVSWPGLSETLYTMAATAVLPVGRYTADLIDLLVTQMGVSLESLHCVGHSLGAQICGIAGSSTTTGNISRITGLDAALPLFLGQPLSQRLDSSDAEFVDAIHTAGGYLGFYDPIGDIDFYPNGGTPIQPGCGIDIGYCSHDRSYEYFAESITSEGFTATECTSWGDYKKDLCTNNTQTIMGDNVDKSLTGKFYLHTNKKMPFAAWNLSSAEEDIRPEHSALQQELINI